MTQTINSLETLKEVEEFKYLRRYMTPRNEINREIDNRIISV